MINFNISHQMLGKAGKDLNVIMYGEIDWVKVINLENGYLESQKTSISN